MTPWHVVGLDNGGSSNNATVLAADGTFLVAELVELPSRVLEGPAVAVEALAESFAGVLARTGTEPGSVRAVGLDTPGPASADGVLSSAGATNFSDEPWRGFDIRGALERRLRLPVVYQNDGNAAALYAHSRHFGDDGAARSSVSAIVGTGLGGGVVESGRVVRGASGMGGELGHVRIAMEGLLVPGQPTPRCNCGNDGDVESVASLTAIVTSLLPYWLGRYAGHELAQLAPRDAARRVRGLGERGDELALHVFDQQAQALGRLFTVLANVLDPDAYFVGGGVVEAAPHFRDWFLERVRAHTVLRAEQARIATFALVPDRDMAGARGSALAAREAVLAGTSP